MAARRPVVSLFGAWAVLTAGCYAVLELVLEWSARHTLVASFSVATGMNRLATASVVSLFLIIVRASLLAGVGEELLFRGAVYGCLRSRWSARVAIVATALAFTAEHRLPIVFPAVVLFGLLLGVAQGTHRVHRRRSCHARLGGYEHARRRLGARIPRPGGRVMNGGCPTEVTGSGRPLACLATPRRQRPCGRRGGIAW